MVLTKLNMSDYKIKTGDLGMEYYCLIYFRVNEEQVRFQCMF